MLHRVNEKKKKKKEEKKKTEQETNFYISESSVFSIRSSVSHNYRTLDWKCDEKLSNLIYKLYGISCYSDNKEVHE